MQKNFYAEFDYATQFCTMEKLQIKNVWYWKFEAKFDFESSIWLKLKTHVTLFLTVNRFLTTYVGIIKCRHCCTILM